MRTAFVLLLAASAVTAPVPKGLKVKPNDAEAIVGYWLSRYANDDNPAAKPPRVRHFFEFDADGGLREGATVGGNTPGNYTLDPTCSPGSIDLMYTWGEKGTFAAIYEIRGDTLKLCIPKKSGGPRPTEFKATDATSLWAYRRQSDEKNHP